ncbi:phosphatase PAP2 family protein [Acidipila sp. EB88]|uniref:phosphatase PAP2 family protein n=1 Tax=Acidipila sp. EB88 TaxID=2305226 RepID=UPI000F5F1D92|nr:phosphatase PAP2 family protein [Acidipila sp. EB88]RRA49164.1 phosphatase PAP2 family protein [Acidipila sp. EB88]
MNQRPRFVARIHRASSIACLALASALCVRAQSLQPPTVATLQDLRGLAAVSALSNTPEGRNTLVANLRVTGGIETGKIRQPTLLPFSGQEQLALSDAYAPGHNLAQPSDGLGTSLAAAYLSHFHAIDREHATPLSPALERLVRYALATTGGHSNAAKFFFGNGTLDGRTPVSAEARAIYTDVHGSPDPFGRAYSFPAGSVGADPNGDSRPFQTEPDFKHYAGIDYLGTPATNDEYDHGKLMDLTGNPSYPSGHTTNGYTGALLLALLVPSRYQQMITRGAEYGNDRIIVGAHYAMDVLGGRTLALHDMAHLLANDPAYVQQQPNETTAAIGDFQAALGAARVELNTLLQASCGQKVEICATRDTGRFRHAHANERFYAATQDYGLGIAHSETAGIKEDVAQIAPEAGYLLTTAFPNLSLQMADRILTETEGPGGGFLDDGSSFGLYSRIDLYTAAGVAAALARTQ